MASTNQEDGCYPRLNATMLQSGQHVNMIASLIGTVESCDGQIAAIKCGDGQTARVAVDPTFVVPPGKTIECIGAVTENGELQVRLDNFIHGAKETIVPWICLYPGVVASRKIHLSDQLLMLSFLFCHLNLNSYS